MSEVCVGINSRRVDEGSSGTYFQATTTSMLAFSTVLSNMKPQRQAEIQSLNAVMRCCCSEERLKFTMNWGTFLGSEEPVPEGRVMFNPIQEKYLN